MKRNIFIKKAKKVHGNRYSYTLVNTNVFKNIKVKIICSLHGVFTQRYDSHLSGAGCVKCSIMKVSNKKKRVSSKNFVKYSNKIRGNYYDYSNGELYDKLGFKHIKNITANYWYFKNRDMELQHRLKYKKTVLVSEGFDVQKTEHQIMADRGFLRIYDSGDMEFKLTPLNSTK